MYSLARLVGPGPCSPKFHLDNVCTGTAGASADTCALYQYLKTALAEINSTLGGHTWAVARKGGDFAAQIAQHAMRQPAIAILHMA